MQFLKKLFNRSSDDDGFDDDEDDDDTPRTQVIMEDDDDEDGGNFEDDPSADDEQPEMGSGTGDDDDDDPFGTDDDDGDDDLFDTDDGTDDDDVEFDDDDDDDFDFDDDDEDDDDDDAEPGGKRKLVFIAAGVGVLLLGIVGGGVFWFLGDDTAKPVAKNDVELAGGVQVALPPRSGSLNALGAGEDDKPAPEQKGDPADSQADNQADSQPGSAEADDDKAPATEPTTENQISSAATLGSSSLNSLAGSGAAGQGIIIPSVTLASYQKVPDQAKATPLASAPDRRLLEKVEGLGGPLPSVSKDGRRIPWEVYARPLTGNEKGQRVGLLVTGLGLSRAATMAAIKKLPGEVSLVFDPYAKDLDDWLLRARLAGHEVFVSLPMESENFPAEDPGPLALTTTLQVADNIKRLHGVLSSFSGYVGVVSSMGSKFSKAEGQLKPILSELKKRGLMFVDGGAIARSVAPRIAAEIDLPRAKSNLTLDETPLPGNISRKLQQLEKMIKENATAIATIRAYPASIHSLVAWTQTLSEKQLALVPVSAIANKQFIE